MKNPSPDEIADVLERAAEEDTLLRTGRPLYRPAAQALDILRRRHELLIKDKRRFLVIMEDNADAAASDPDYQQQLDNTLHEINLDLDATAADIARAETDQQRLN